MAPMPTTQAVTTPLPAGLARDALPVAAQTAAAGWATAAPRRMRPRLRVRIVKYALPLGALALLSSIALWPELTRTVENGRATWRQLTMINGSGQMLHPRYHGLDGRERPYTVSAETAERDGPDRINMHLPVGDVSLQNGTWLLVRAKTGVFMQHSNQLDLAHDVTLFRQDGTIMTSDTATMDVKQGAAVSDDTTHAEGPFGTLDAQGFTLVDKGSVIQFHGPARLVLNGTH